MSMAPPSGAIVGCRVWSACNRKVVLLAFQVLPLKFLTWTQQNSDSRQDFSLPRRSVEEILTT
jgi:hypothetical protein